MRVAARGAHFGAGGEDIKVPENGSESLAQASYGKVSVGKGAELLLVGGDYFIEELYVDDDATIWFDPADGPITLNVKKKLDLGESIEMKLSSGRTRDITINVLQEEEVGDRFHGLTEARCLKEIGRSFD